MGVPIPRMEAAVEATAEGLLGSLRPIAAAERRKHASVFNYWLSIRGDREFPPIRDLDPLEISDAGPFSVLLEMIGAEDAEIRHLGQAIDGDVEVAKLSDAPNSSVLYCIASRIPVVVACRQPFAFEDELKTPDGKKRCWVTLLPFSATGTWIDYIYGFVSLDPPPELDAVEEQVAGPIEEMLEPESEPELVDETSGPQPVQAQEELQPNSVEQNAAADDEPEVEARTEPEPPAKPARESAAASKPNFSAKVLESLANVGGFYGRNVQVEPELPAVPVTAEERESGKQSSKLNSSTEETMETKLTDVRAKADEARMAKLRSNIALYEGLSAAYDFALDAEERPEEYLKLVEAQGLKIQLRSPMKPVVRLAFDGMCDDSTIAQLEAVLAWALKMDLPRGSLGDRIEAEGGIGPILNGQASAV
jgi:hypothetical protein